MNVEKLLSKRLLTTDEMAKILNVNVRTVRQMVRRNDIPFIRINRWHIRFDPETIEAWLKSREGIEPDERPIWDGRRKAGAKRKGMGE
jgi:excisionase family DNA binding protein